MSHDRARHLASVFFLLAASWPSLAVGGVARHCAVRIHSVTGGGFVRAVANAPDGALWIGTNQGLARYDGDLVSWMPVSRREGMEPVEPISALFADRRGGTWLIAQGVFERRGEHFRTWGPAQGLPADRVDDLAEDRGGQLWASSDAGLFRRKGEGWQRVRAGNGPSQDPTRLWRARDGSLHWEQGGAWTPIDEEGQGVSRAVGHTYADARNARLLEALVAGPPQLPPADHNRLVTGHIEALLYDQRGRLWIGADDGLLCVAPGESVWFDVKAGLPDDHVRHLVEDREGNIWVATHGGGLARLEPAYPVPASAREGVGGGTTFSVAETPDGVLWATTVERLARIDGTAVTNIEPRTAAGRRLFLRSLVGARDGSLWAASMNSEVVRYVPAEATFTAWPLPGALDRERVSALADEGGGSVLLGTTAGRLLRAGPTGLTMLYAPAPPCRSRPVFEKGACVEAASVLAPRRSGGFWMGTFGMGLWMIHGPSVAPRPVPGGRSMGHIWDLLEDAEGVVWLAADQGLGRFTGGKHAWFAKREGLAESVAFAVMDDLAGRLWLGGMRGVQVVKKADLLTGRAAPAIFDAEDGLPSDLVMGAYDPAVLRARDGRIWFATVSGLAAFDPNGLDTTPPPTARLGRVSADGRVVELPASGASLTVPPGRGDLAFEFTAVALRARHRLRYQYQLVGFDPAWVDAGARSVAHYTNLPPGRYQFRLRALRQESRTPGPEAALPLELEPHFYQRALFHWTLGVLAVALVLSVYGVRMRQVRARYQVVAEERRRIARDLHDSLAQVFAALAFQVDLLLRTPNGADETSRDERARQLRRMVTHARRAMRAVVWNLRAAPEDPAALERALSELGGLYEGARVSVTVTGPPRALPLGATNEVLFIAQQAVSNAIEHGGARNVGVEIEYGDGRFALWMRDDGAGFDARKVTTAEEGLHFGLRGMSERATRAGGRLLVESTPGVGSEIGVVIEGRSRSEAQANQRAEEESR